MLMCSSHVSLLLKVTPTMGSGATIQALDNNIPKVLQLSREQKEIFIFYGDHMILKTQYSQQQ